MSETHRIQRVATSKLDKALTRILKGGSAAERSTFFTRRGELARVGGAPLGEALSYAERVCWARSADHGVDASALATLSSAGLPGVAGYVFTVIASRQDARTDALLGAALTAKSVAHLVSSKRCTKKGLQERVRGDARASYVSALGDWALGTLKPEEASRLLILALRLEPRPPHLTRPVELAKTAVARVKSAKSLQALLASIDAHGTPSVRHRFWNEVLTSSRPSLLRAVPAALSSRVEKQSTLVHAEGDLACLARITLDKGVKQQPRSHAAMFVAGMRCHLEILASTRGPGGLDAIRKLASELARRIVAAGEGLMAAIGADSGAPPPGTADQADDRHRDEFARLLVAALERAHRGEPAVPLIEALALNAGLERVGREGERCDFDPLLHQLESGGCLTGEPVEVLRSGWSRDGVVLQPAVVRALKGDT